MAHNYTFWADLIFKPKSREEGMLLMVEGTSRWCWCHPFHHKDAVTIAGIVEKFINLIDERITCLVTDAGTEWNGIPPLTEKYGFVWKRKNVTLTGHGAMARLDRTVRTLRKYMEDAFFGLTRKEQGRVTWYLMFQMAVERFNKVPHSFSDWEPEHLVQDPWEMHQTRLKDYKRGWKNYRSLNPYFRIKKRLERLPKGRRESGCILIHKISLCRGRQ